MSVLLARARCVNFWRGNALIGVMFRMRQVIICAAFAAVTFVQIASARELVLVTPVDTVDTVISEVIIKEAYRRINIEAVIRKYPAERALHLANNGRVDGEVQRIDGINKKYSNLVQVTPPINFISATVFTMNESFIVKDWKSLAPYSIGIVRGIKFAERNTVGMDVHKTGSYETLIKALKNKRVQIIVAPRLNGLYQIRRMGISGIRALTPDVMRFQLFHYLHSKHEALVPAVSLVLKKMHNSGELTRIRDHVVQVMLERAGRGAALCDEDYACFGGWR